MFFRPTSFRPFVAFFGCNLANRRPSMEAYNISKASKAIMERGDGLPN